MIDRRLIHNFDWGLLLIVVLLGAMGLTTIYSAVTADPPPGPQKVLFYKQMVWFAIGIIVMAASFSFSYRLLDRWAHPIYIACVLLLLGSWYSESLPEAPGVGWFSGRFTFSPPS